MSHPVGTNVTKMEIDEQKRTTRSATSKKNLEKSKKLKYDIETQKLITRKERSILIPKKVFDDYNKKTKRFLKAGEATSKIKNVIGSRIDKEGDFYRITFEDYLFPLSDENAKNIITNKNILKQILYSSSEGLMHFHKKGFTHRKISPESIVICEENEGYVGKLSDLTLSKDSKDSTVSSDFDLNICSAPEIIKNLNENQEKYPVRQSADVFSMGVVFYYALTREYPYDTIGNIVNDKYVINYGSIKEKSEFLKEEWDFLLAKQLIKSMLNRDPEKRPTIKQVMNHPFFWNLTRKEHFLMTASQYIQGKDTSMKIKPKKKKTTEEMDKLNNKLNNIFENWRDKVDKTLLLNRNKKIDYENTASDLLRFLRNFPAHYPERKNEEQRKVIAKEGAVNYCLNKIPIFFVHFYSYFNDAPHSEYDTLRKFYCDCYLSTIFEEHSCLDEENTVGNPMDTLDDGKKEKKFIFHKWVEEEI